MSSLPFSPANLVYINSAYIDMRLWENNFSGDCAHPMLPYMAQGANSSLEDAATIGGLLAKVQRREQIPSAMAMYDAIRRPRVDQLVRETFAQGKEHHLPNGPEQRHRDHLLRRSMEEDGAPDSQDPW